MKCISAAHSLFLSGKLSKHIGVSLLLKVTNSPDLVPALRNVCIGSFVAGFQFLNLLEVGDGFFVVLQHLSSL